MSWSALSWNVLLVRIQALHEETTGPKIHWYDTVCSMIASRIACFQDHTEPKSKNKNPSASFWYFFSSEKSFEKHHFTIQHGAFARCTDWGLPLSKMVGLTSLSSKNNQVTYPDNSDCLTIELQYSRKLCADCISLRSTRARMLIGFKTARDSMGIRATNPYTSKFILKRSICASMKDKKQNRNRREEARVALVFVCWFVPLLLVTSLYKFKMFSYS